jgi:hypothetical protein
MLPDWWIVAAQHYRLFRDGRLLVAGGIADQPAPWLELMGFIGRAIDEYDAAKRKQEEKR